MSTRDSRGTAQYLAPEIIHAQPGVTTYGSAVDIYGIGLILYEVFTGHRVFYTREQASKLPPCIPQLYYSPKLPVLGHFTGRDEVANAYATRVVSTPLDHINDKVRSRLTEFWNAVKEMELTELTLLGEVNSSIPSRLEEINKLLKVMLHFDPAKRPTINVLEHHFRALVIRSLLENDVV